ncbi:MAG: hypothetical protein ACR2P9_02190 [Gammaproteobacteria bacterium]
MTPEQRKQLFTLLLLLTVCVAPFALSWYLLSFTDVSKIKIAHNGELIDPPRPLEDIQLYNPAAPGSEEFFLHGKWSLVYLLDGPCDRDCEQNIYRMRQIRLATNKYAHRVQRVVIHTADGTDLFNAQQIRDYQGQLMLSYGLLDKPEYQGLFQIRPEDQPFSRQRLYLIDPLGNLMMMYEPGIDPRGIIKDMTRLLKYSRLG